MLEILKLIVQSSITLVAVWIGANYTKKNQLRNQQLQILTSNHDKWKNEFKNHISEMIVIFKESYINISMIKNTPENGVENKVLNDYLSNAYQRYLDQIAPKSLKTQTYIDLSLDENNTLHKRLKKQYEDVMTKYNLENINNYNESALNNEIKEIVKTSQEIIKEKEIEFEKKIKLLN